MNLSSTAVDIQDIKHQECQSLDSISCLALSKSDEIGAVFLPVGSTNNLYSVPKFIQKGGKRHVWIICGREISSSDSVVNQESLTRGMFSGSMICLST
jgi:hypothetical protein